MTVDRHYLLYASEQANLQAIWMDYQQFTYEERILLEGYCKAEILILEIAKKLKIDKTLFTERLSETREQTHQRIYEFIVYDKFSVDNGLDFAVHEKV